MQDELRALLKEPMLPRGTNVKYLASAGTDLAERLMHHEGSASQAEHSMPLSKKERLEPMAAAVAVNPARKVKVRRR